MMNHSLKFPIKNKILSFPLWIFMKLFPICEKKCHWNIFPCCFQIICNIFSARLQTKCHYNRIGQKYKILFNSSIISASANLHLTYEIINFRSVLFSWNNSMSHPHWIPYINISLLQLLNIMLIITPLYS